MSLADADAIFLHRLHHQNSQLHVRRLGRALRGARIAHLETCSIMDLIGLFWERKNQLARDFEGQRPLSRTPGFPWTTTTTAGERRASTQLADITELFSARKPCHISVTSTMELGMGLLLVAAALRLTSPSTDHNRPSDRLRIAQSNSSVQIQ
jgi:hypothetical protein